MPWVSVERILKLWCYLIDLLEAVVRLNANSDRFNLNCNRNPQNAKASFGITQELRGLEMKTYKNLYKRLCSKETLFIAYKKARKGKSKKPSVIEFEKNLIKEIDRLHQELINKTYIPCPLKRFIVRDPKTRVIHASSFRDRVVHHAIIIVLNPIYEKLFIHDSFASRINKGTHKAVKRFEYFMRKVARNGTFVKNPYSNNSVQGYVLKADIRKYFDTVDHEILISIIREKIRDEELIWLIRRVLDNFNIFIKGKGMPLGNYTSQFFANVYLNKLDYFIKHELKAKYYIRYVDDFVILHRSRKRLVCFREKIIEFLKELRLEIHPCKSEIKPLQKGIQFLGYRIFYHHKLLTKRNLYKIKKNIDTQLALLRVELVSRKDVLERLQGWFGYAKWANTYKLREKIKKWITLFNGC